MSLSTHIRIRTDVDARAETMAKKLGLKKKEFVEEAVLFFVRHNLSPINFSPSADFDLSQLVQKSTERIISYIKHQEQEMIAPLALEVLRAQIAVQALMNLIIDVNIPAEEQASVANKLEEYMNSQVEKLQIHAHQGHQSAAGRE
ncbi:BfmA/BtgA family mobilization protein [Cesiribacter sp. SM1]|uniref:BfmA/BtgA family mobilization protein n=1 Tax=Cesiribacter sp. SM1 TaxID=2861196 RepID=UPI00271551C8|nr:BfmA/BtgA family mobilization protein [Cesiribacter sp. SM1]